MTGWIVAAALYALGAGMAHDWQDYIYARDKRASPIWWAGLIWPVFGAIGIAARVVKCLRRKQET